MDFPEIVPGSIAFLWALINAFFIENILDRLTTDSANSKFVKFAKNPSVAEDLRIRDLRILSRKGCVRGGRVGLKHFPLSG